MIIMPVKCFPVTVWYLRILDSDDSWFHLQGPRKKILLAVLSHTKYHYLWDCPLDLKFSITSCCGCVVHYQNNDHFHVLAPSILRFIKNDDLMKTKNYDKGMSIVSSHSCTDQVIGSLMLFWNEKKTLTDDEFDAENTIPGWWQKPRGMVGRKMH